jgi:preprotein translocase subunit YajC
MRSIHESFLVLFSKREQKKKQKRIEYESEDFSCGDAVWGYGGDGAGVDAECGSGVA